MFRRHLEKRPYVESFKNTIELKGASRVDIAERFVAYDSSVHSAAFRTLAATKLSKPTVKYMEKRKPLK
jgi:hypothetical protein